MKLLTYQLGAVSSQRLGTLVRVPQHPDTNLVLDLRQAYSSYLQSQDDPFAEPIAAIRIPSDVRQYLEGGERSQEAVRHALEYVEAAAPAEIECLFAHGALLPLESVRLLAPIARPCKIIAVGANYASHVQEAREAGVLRDLPNHPVGFLKMPSSVTGPDSDIVRSRYTEELDYEIELAMVIGTRCRNVSRENWREVVAGFTIVNDISMRDLILSERALGVFYGKNLDTACPLGPYIVTLDEFHDPNALDVCLRVNGVVRQHDNTRNMIFSCAEILAYWSSRITLEPGDVITTGTTGGVAGFGKRFPERLLKPGDIVEAEIEGIGVLRNRVVAEDSSAAHS